MSGILGGGGGGGILGGGGGGGILGGGGGGGLVGGLLGGGGQGGFLNQILSGGNTPQAQGYGISQPGRFQPYSTGGGLQRGGGYNPNLDISGPGAMEQYWSQLQGQNRTMPPETPGLDPYYERARERTAADVNNQLAATGQLGSTVGADQFAQAMGGLSAEQANREADYALQRSRNQLDWTSGLGGLASGAQAARQGRVGDLYGAQMGMGDRLSGQYLNQMNQMFGNDMSGLQAAIDPQAGLGAEARNQGYRGQERHKEDAKWGAGLMGNVLGGMAGK